MVTQKQQQTIQRYVNTIYELLIDQINGIRIDPTKRTLHTNKNIFVRMLGQMLYEAPKLHTGKVSVRLVEQKLNNFSVKPCLEHHHSRQKGGAALVSLIERAIATGVDPTANDVYIIVIKFCQVHYTTGGENAMLRKHQRRCTSEAAYRRSNIQLVDAPDLFAKRGKHSQSWKQQMLDKYSPIVDLYNNPILLTTEQEWPDIIH